MAAITGYDIRLRNLAGGRGLRSVRVAAVSAPEARRVAELLNEGWVTVNTRRSDYAIGESERRARREALAGKGK